ncbi:MAG: hypothetical protein GY796_24710 [Chloroflexi bacterium]|nr:hypothetical protein [Chloroflexota bacterium]
MSNKIFQYKFNGQQGQRDIGWAIAHWYDFKNVQVPIDHEDGVPTHWVYWEAEGKSYFADNEDWNRFKSPEQRFMWKKFLPEHEHDTLLNDIGQSYNWFHGNSPFHSRIARPTMLKKGQVELTFEFYADWYQWKKKKIPINKVGDQNNCRVELEILDTGLSAPLNWQDEGAIPQNQGQLNGVLNQMSGQHDDNWLIVNPTLGHTVKTRTIDVPHDGLYLLVYGIYTVWAVIGGHGRNGLFVLSTSAQQLTGGVPDDISKSPDLKDEKPPTDAQPTQRGQPRLQYERTFQLIHGSVSDDRASQIFLQGFRQGKTTGTSADDAGLGDLDVKIVEVYGWPAVEQGDLIAWFSQHYPGTQVKFLD